jgi:hypothetical protein
MFVMIVKLLKQESYKNSFGISSNSPAVLNSKPLPVPKLCNALTCTSRRLHILAVPGASLSARLEVYVERSCRHIFVIYIAIFRYFFY